MPKSNSLQRQNTLNEDDTEFEVGRAGRHFVARLRERGVGRASWKSSQLRSSVKWVSYILQTSSLISRAFNVDLGIASPNSLPCGMLLCHPGAFESSANVDFESGPWRKGLWWGDSTEGGTRWTVRDVIRVRARWEDDRNRGEYQGLDLIVRRCCGVCA